jgi:hypothetical protein
VDHQSDCEKRQTENIGAVIANLQPYLTELEKVNLADINAFLIKKILICILYATIFVEKYAIFLNQNFKKMTV